MDDPIAAVGAEQFRVLTEADTELEEFSILELEERLEFADCCVINGSGCNSGNNPPPIKPPPPMPGPT